MSAGSNTIFEDLRLSKRTKLFVAAKVVIDQQERPARVRDLSLFGARIELLKAPPIGTSILLKKGNLAAPGTVVWASTGVCGIVFNSEIPLLDWLSPNSDDHNSSDGPMRPPRKKALPDIPPPMTLKDPTIIATVLPERIADELAYLSRVIEGACANFIKNPIVLSRYQADLQALDLAASSLVQISAVLSADDPARAACDIALGSLRFKLLRTSRS